MVPSLYVGVAEGTALILLFQIFMILTFLTYFMVVILLLVLKNI